MLFLAATGIHRGKKQCQIFLRLLGWNDKPPTPIQIIQAYAVAAFEKLCAAQLSWLPNVPEMELYGVERCGCSMFFWYTQKHPKTARCEKWWPSLGIGVRHSHRSSEMVPEVPTWTNKNSRPATARCSSIQTQKTNWMWHDVTKQFQQSWLQIPSDQSIPASQKSPLRAAPYRYLAFAFRRHGLHDGRPWPGSLYGEVERPAEVRWVMSFCSIFGTMFFQFIFLKQCSDVFGTFGHPWNKWW